MLQTRFCQTSHMHGLHVTICPLKQAVAFKATVLQYTSIYSTPTNSNFSVNLISAKDASQQSCISMSQDFHYFNPEIELRQIFQSRLVSNCTLCHPGSQKLLLRRLLSNVEDQSRNPKISTFKSCFAFYKAWLNIQGQALRQLHCCNVEAL